MSGERQDAFKRFEELAKKLVSVPKKELDRKRALYNAKKKRKTERKDQ